MVPVPTPAAELLQSITIPWGADGDAVLGCYKAALRPLNSHAFVNAGFKLTASADGTVTKAILAFGGIGAGVVRATRAEACLVGKPASQATFKEVRPACRVGAGVTPTLIPPLLPVCVRARP